MDISEEERMEVKAMSERIAELDHSQSQLKKLNADMRRWLEVADDEVAQLRLENAALLNQVTNLEKAVGDAAQVESELCRVRTLLVEEQDTKRRNQKEIQKWENEQNVLREQNEKLITELYSLQQQREQDQTDTSSLRAALQTLQYEMDETQLGLKHKDDVIQQQTLQLKHLEESAEESSNIIGELRLKVQDLKNQLELRQDDLSCAGLDDLMRREDGLAGRPLSFAEEVELLASSSVESTEAEEPQATVTLESPPVHVQTNSSWHSSTGSLVQGACLLPPLILGFLIPLGVLASVVCVCSGGSCDFFSSNTFWSSVYYLLQPYCNVQHVGLPPI